MSGRTGRALGRLGRGEKNNGGKEVGGRSQRQGRGMSVSLVICDPDDSDILELVKGVVW